MQRIVSMSNVTPRRTLVVTGASSGIGREVARLAPEFGFDVVAVARRKDRLDALARELHARGAGCVTLDLDVRAPHAAKTIVDAAQTTFGRIDVLLNNAGVGAPGNLLDQSDAAIAAQWDLHVLAPLRVTRAALPMLRSSHGQVMFVGSGLARVPSPGFGAYAPVKAAIRAAAIQLRRELHGDGIAVTYIDPGAVETEFSQASGMERASSAILKRADRVARRILRGTETRSRRVNASPLQTAGVVLGEWFPLLADFVIARVVDKPREAPESREMTTVQPTAQPQTLQSDTPFERALEPVARRLERVKLPQTFLAEQLQPGAELQLGELAMRWAGMPNKNERAAMAEALDALTAGGFLEKMGDETWRVVRSA
ncbi:MAG: SDR family NAD(P)-dependent oxidoreductase [Candidatus Eremiobacteraeota bacterium]|nr:SDR family NAD(P)-dependent oxidoreductase [Candidatus Eremiobacteraeota bacterium]